MHINELINPASLAHDIKQGLIREQRHPHLPLRILNYTNRAQCSRSWSNATLLCRGLIVHEDGRVIARPFPKFFNWDEQPPKGSQFRMDLDEPVSVSDKLDGSLGILYPRGAGQGYAIATRGSFASDQALHATVVWQERYADGFRYCMSPEMTYLFEIIYPENRIVVDYKGLDDLVLLGAVHTPTGVVFGPDVAPGWPGPRARVFPYRTLREAVTAKPRAGHEGFVVRSESGLMVKVKYADYVSLHRVVTGLNEKEVWRRTMNAHLNPPVGVSMMDVILGDIPDELHGWVQDTAWRLVVSYQDLVDKVDEAWNRITNMPGWHSVRGDDRDVRRVFAQIANQEPPLVRNSLFLRLDGVGYGKLLWKSLEPKGDTKK